MSTLSRAEREVVLRIADDEASWHVFTDSRRLDVRLLQVAARWGVRPTRLGAGWEFTLPLEAVRFVRPQRLSAEERERRAQRLRAVRQDGHSASRGPVVSQAAGGLARREGSKVGAGQSNGPAAVLHERQGIPRGG